MTAKSKEVRGAIKIKTAAKVDAVASGAPTMAVARHLQLHPLPHRPQEELARQPLHGIGIALEVRVDVATFLRA